MEIFTKVMFYYYLCKEIVKKCFHANVIKLFS